MTKPPIFVLGAGAMGLLWASQLCKQGWRVCLIHKNLPAQLKSSPISLISADNKINYKVSHFLASQIDTKIPMLLVTVKAHQLAKAIKPLLPRITPRTLIVLTQNGMGADKELLTHFPQLRQNLVLQTVTTHGALKLGILEVKQTGVGYCWLGNNPYFHPNNIKPPNSSELDLFLQLDLINGWNQNLQQLMWQKLIINASINPLGAILNCRNGELLKKKYLPMLGEIVNECCEIASSAGLKNSQQIFQPESMLEKVIQVCRNTSENRSSMLEDMIHHRQTEVRYINQYLLNLANHKEIDAPWNLCLISILNTINRVKIV